MSDQIFDVKSVCFQLINPKDGTRTHVVTLPQEELLGVLKKVNGDAFINVFSLDTTLNPDPQFCLHPLVRVASFIDFYQEHFNVEHKGVSNNEAV